MIVGIMLKIFQRKVLKLTLQLIQAEFMSQRGIEIACLFSYTMTRLLVYGVTKLTHHIHTIGNHDEYDTHILCKRNDKITEILSLNHRSLLIEMI